MMSKKIAVLPGDGIGPEVISSAVAVLNSLTNDIELINGDIGYECYKRTGSPLPRTTIDIIEECDAVLLGGITVPVDEKNFRNPLYDIKKRLDLYADVRYVSKIVPDLGILSDFDSMFVRYSDEGSFNVTEINELDGATLTRRVSYLNAKRLCNFTKDLMMKHNRENISCVHKTDLYPLSDGVLLNTFKEVMEGSGLNFTSIKAEDMIAEIITSPRSVDTIISTNPYSDLLSESVAALVGGSQLVPVALLGDEKGLFKPLHNSNPTLEGLNIVNPTAMLISTSMMLDFIGYEDEAELLRVAIRSAYKRGYRTPDVGGDMGTYDFTTQVVKICENPQ